MIKGIDAQVMIQRSVDYAKQNSDHIANVNQAQDFLKKLDQERRAQDTRTVNQTNKSEQDRVEREKKKQEQRESAQKRKKQEEAARPREILDDVSKLDVGYAFHSGLDIEV